MPNKKRKLHIIEDGEVEFVFTEQKKKDKRVYKLKRSQNPAWTNPGEHIAKIVDDGNGISLNGKHFEYHEFSEIMHLVKCLEICQPGEWADVEITENVNSK